jgi:hypothetical protein
VLRTELLKSVLSTFHFQVCTHASDSNETLGLWGLVNDVSRITDVIMEKMGLKFLGGRFLVKLRRGDRCESTFCGIHDRRKRDADLHVLAGNF